MPETRIYRSGLLQIKDSRPVNEKAQVTNENLFIAVTGNIGPAAQRCVKVAEFLLQDKPKLQPKEP